MDQHQPGNLLESFLNEKKLLLDVDFDEERVWLSVSGKLHRQRNLRRNIMAIAASLVILLSVSVWLFMVRQPHDMTSGTDLKGDIEAWSTVEFGPEARLFNLAVEQKLAEVPKAGADPAALRELSVQLALIDRHQLRYMADLKEIGPDPRILRGIIRCYEQKIRIIEKTLNRIEKTSRDEALPKFRII